MNTLDDRKIKALKAVSDAFSDNHLTFEEAIHIMAVFVNHIGKKCNSPEYAAVMMVLDLQKLIPKLESVAKQGAT